MSRWLGSGLVGRGRVLLVGLLAAGALLGGFTGTARALTNTGAAAPTIWSDKADYAAGETVTLSGADWQPGETVHIVVDDTLGQTWQHVADVTAAADGTITDTFQLANWFVALYTVTATGPVSGMATTTFTDAPPSPSITSVSKTTLNASDSTDVTWKSNQDIDSWSVRVGGTDCSTGSVVDSGTTLAKNVSHTTTIAASSLAEGSNTIRVCVTNSGGTGSTTTTVTKDTTAPSAAITFPTGASYNTSGWNGGCGTPTTGDFCGTSSDGTGSGVQKVEVSIQRLSDGKYWNGTSFASATEVLFTATGTTSWSFTFAASNFTDGSYTVRAKATDNAANAGTVVSSTFTIDNTAPTVSSINRNDTNPTNASSVHWLVTFSEGVSGVNASDFSLVGTGATGASITSVAINASPVNSWTVTATTSGDGTLGLNLVDDDSIKDSAGNPLGGSGTGNGNFTGQVYTVDKSNPTAAITFPAAGGVYSTSTSPNTWNAGCGTPTTGDICGTASDTGGSNLQKVEISIRQGTGNYWNGTSFGSATEVLFTATGTTSWSFNFAGSSFPADGSYTVRAKSTDGAGNTASATNTFTMDSAPPSASITFPAAAGSYTASTWDTGCSTPGGDLCGTASDATSGVQKVEVSIQRGSDNTYWNGTSFSSASEVLFTATGTTSWSYAFPSANFPAAGSYTVRAKSTDVAGNVSSVATATFTIAFDTIAPTTTASATSGGSSYASGTATKTNVDISLSATDNTGGSGVKSITYSATGAQPITSTTVNAATATVPTISAEGTTTVSFHATDNAGNVETPDKTFVVKIDKTAPTVAIDSVSKTTLNASDASTDVTWHANENGSYSVRVGGTDCLTGTQVASASYTTQPATVTTTVSASSLAEGQNTIRVCVTDAATNSGSDSRTVTKDTVAPAAPSITSSPASPGNGRSPSWSFTGETGASFQCSLTRGATTVSAFASCASPKSYDLTGQPDGTYTFHVKQTDAAGNTGPESTADYTLDTTAPAAPSITASPTSPGSSRSPSWSFTGETGASFQCSLTRGATIVSAFATCTSPKSYDLTGQPDGMYTFHVKQTDLAGNPGPESTSDYVLDTTAPAAPSITASPASPGNGRSPSWSFTGESGGGFQCSLTRGATTVFAFAGCSSPKSFDLTGQPDGVYTFHVKQTDAAGNTGPESTADYTLDTTAPAAPSITSSPASPGNGRSPSWSFGGEAGGSFQCSLTRGATIVSAFATCTSPKSYDLTGQPDGVYTFHVKQTDAAGNTGAESTADYTLDTTAPPAPSIDSHPSDPTNSTSASFAFSDTEAGVSFLCQLDGGGFTACTSPKSYAVTEGTHSFDVQAKDTAGNVSAATSFSWKVDTTAPTVAIDSVSKTTLNASDASTDVTWHANENGSYSVRVGGTDCLTGTQVASGSYTTQPATVTTTVNASSLAEGQNAIRVCVKDAATNTGSDSRTVTKDTIPPPAPSIDSHPSDPTNSTSASFGFSDTEAGVSFLCQRDSGGYVACTSPQSYTVAEGSHSFDVKAKDAAGNLSAASSFSWNVDTTAPASTASAPVYSTSNTINVTYTAADPGVGASGLATVELWVKGPTDVAYSKAQTDTNPGTTGGFTYTASSQGTYSFYTIATDKAGNPEAVPTLPDGTTVKADAITFVDPFPPDSSANAPAYSLSTSITVGYTASDTGSGVDTVELWAKTPGATGYSKVGTNSTGAAAGSFNYTAAAGDGTYSFYTVATDKAGNREAAPASADATTFVDTAPPDTSITAKPSDPTNSGSASFSFTGSDSGSGVDHFECSLDGADFANCTSPKSYTVADGSHTFQVRSVDKAGNPDPTPASFSWLVDTIPPDTTITSEPSDPSSSSVASFAFTYSDASPSSGLDRFECSLDNGAFATCASGVTYPGLAEGSHTFQVRAIDKAGNVDATPDSFTWFVDTMPPDTSISSGPADPTKSASASFSFAGTDPAPSSGGLHFECSLDGATFTTCASPTSYTVLDGSHTFRVRAIDAAGNFDATPASYTWFVDTVAPETSISSGPADPSSSSSASFGFAATDASPSSGIDRLECKLDAGAFTPCTSPASYTVADGSHTFQVRAVDKAGNVDATPASYTWFVDTVPPDTAITSHPNDPSNSSSASFSFTGSDSSPSSGIDRFECALDQEPFATCSSPTTYTGLADGPHIFYVRAFDKAGNYDSTPASSTWFVDTVAPDTSITSHPDDPTASNSASFSFTGSDASPSSGINRFECSLDGGGFVTCTSPASYGPLSDGTHTFQVRAVDNAGNADTSPASFSWLVDTTPPDTSITNGPADPTSATSATFAFTGSDAGSGVDRFECKLDAGTFASCASPATYNALADGSHTFQVRAIDKVGNVDPTPASFTWFVDTAPPDTAITAHPSDPSNSSSASFEFKGTDPAPASGVASFECSLDGATFTTCTSPASYTSLADGSHTFRVRAIDKTGNVDPTPDSFTWLVDTTPPDTTITSHPNDPSGSSSASFGFTGSDSGSGVDHFECKLDGDPFAACKSPVSYTGLADGVHTFQVRAVDKAGNADPTPASFSWLVDTTSPETTITSHPNDPTNSTSASFGFTGTDPAPSSGGVHFECKLDAAPFSACTSPASYGPLSDGSHTFQVRAIDAVGNVDPTPASFTWLVDTGPPTASITFPTAGGSYNASTWDSGCGTPAGDICGTASDTGSGVAKVEISIRQGTGNYWNGTSFSSATEVFVAASGTTSWSYAFSSSSFPADGSYTIRARAIDKAGNIGSAVSTTFTVNAPPQANPGGPYTGFEGSAVNLNGSVSSDTTSSSWSYTAGPDVDPGTVCTFGNASSPTTSFTCNDDGTFTVTLTANDGTNAPVSKSTTVKLDNVKPTVTITSPSNGYVTSHAFPVTVRGTFSDPANHDTHTAVVDCGNGQVSATVSESGGAGSFTATCKYSVAGTWTVTAYVTDDDGGTGTSQSIKITTT